MWQDRVSDPGPLTYESGALYIPTALRGSAKLAVYVSVHKNNVSVYVSAYKNKCFILQVYRKTMSCFVSIYNTKSMFCLCKCTFK